MQWQQVAPAIRQRSFFSATVQSAKVLTSWREMLLDYLADATETVTTPDGEQVTAYKETSLAKFREKAATFAVKEGIATPEDFKNDKITNVVGLSRLQLVYNTNTFQSKELAWWRQRISDPDYVNRYPAASFERSPGGNSEDFRPLHVANEGAIRRWDDFDFWLEMNSEDIGGFGVPWGPWGFNSYMRQVPVSRKKAEALGLVRPDEKIQPPDVSRFGIDLEAQALGDHEDELDEVPEEVKAKARQRLIARLGPDAIDKNGNPSLKAFAAARARLKKKYG